MRKHPGKALTNMVLSCVLCSIAVNWVALPNGFVVTGITGLSMAAAQFTGVNYALIYYGLALAILLCTALALGWREVSNILVLSLLYPVVLWGLNHIQVEIILQEKLIAVMLFGAIYGLGSGLTYRLGYSYGGTDTLAKLLKQRLFRTVPLKYLLLALDGGIMLLMLSAFSLDAVAYAFVGQLLYVSCMNHVIFNLGPKLYEVEIICDQPQKIERFIIQDIHKSATIDQVGAAAMYRSVTPDYFKAVRDEYKKRRDTVVEELGKLPGVKFDVPDGAFYMMVTLPVDDVEKLQYFLLEEFEDNGETVMYAPGSGFYADPDDGRCEVRIAYVHNCEYLRRAIELLGRGIAAYNRKRGV